MPSTRDLDSGFRDAAQAIFDVAKELDRGFRITSSRRTRADQQRLWNNYVSGQSDLPAAPPGKSKHEMGLAVDIARPDVDPFEDEYLQRLGEIWKEAGGIWGGDFDDPVHFESPDGPSDAPKVSQAQGLRQSFVDRKAELRAVFDFFNPFS
jgi:hypothetical protein